MALRTRTPPEGLEALASPQPDTNYPARWVCASLSSPALGVLLMTTLQVAPSAPSHNTIGTGDCVARALRRERISGGCNLGALD